MPVIPEKWQLDSRVQSELGAQFWAQPVQSARVIAGSTCTAPCEPPPLSLTAPSGLSRTQLVVAAHAAGLPLYPGYCEEHGGAVSVLVGCGEGWGAAGDRGDSCCAGRRVGDGPAAPATLLTSTLLSIPGAGPCHPADRAPPLVVGSDRAAQGAAHGWAAQHPHAGGWWVVGGPPSDSGAEDSGALDQRSAAEAPNDQAATDKHPCNPPSTLNQTKPQRETLSDPDNYALAASGRLLLSKATTLRAYMQADDLNQVPASFCGWGVGGWRGGKSSRRQGGGDVDGSNGEVLLVDAAASTAGTALSASSSNNSSAARGMSAALQLKQQLLDGYDLTADLAVNEPSLDGVHRAVNTPLRLSVDVAPRPTQRLGPLLYRVGVHGVLAPATVDSAGGAGGSSSSHILAAHMQGALALAGHTTLWQASNKPWQRRSKQDQARKGVGIKPRPLGIGGDKQQQQQPAVHPADSFTNQRSTFRRASSASDGDDDGSGVPTRRHAGKPRRSQQPAGARDSGPPLVTPGQVQDGLQQTTWRLERLRTDLQSWANRARAGELLRTGKTGKRGAAAAQPGGCWSSLLPAPHLRVGGLVGVLGRVPLHHSTFDAAPHHSARHTSRRGRRGQPSAAAPDAAAALVEGNDALAAGAGGSGGATAWLRHLGGASRGFMEHVVFGGLSGLGGFGSHLAHDVGVRLFAGGGASLQLGHMRRSFFDFTKLEATVDLGLTGPRIGGSSSGSSSSGSGALSGEGAAAAATSRVTARHRRGHHSSSATNQQPQQQRGQRHPAFALDDTGAWHALSLSACQQLIGPIRLRADWRLGLDSSVPLALSRRVGPAGSGSLGNGGGGGGGGVGGIASSFPLLSAAPQAAAQLARHVGGMRPSLLDAAYGLDVIVPGSGGMVRGVVWFSPRRGEGGIELRLL